jgi:hypothetical protein
MGYDRVSTLLDLAPSVLDQIALRKPSDGPRAVAHMHTCSARFGMRVAEDGHLTFLRARF